MWLLYGLMQVAIGPKLLLYLLVGNGAVVFAIAVNAVLGVRSNRFNREITAQNQDLGSTQSLVDTKKQQRPAIKQGTPCDGVWRDQPWSSVGALSTKL